MLMRSSTNQDGVYSGFKKILDTLTQAEKAELLAQLSSAA